MEKQREQVEILTISEIAARLKMKPSFFYAPVRRKGPEAIPCLRWGGISATGCPMSWPGSSGRMRAGMIDRAFALHCRLYLWRLSRRINDGLWDRDLSRSVDCLDFLVMTFGSRGKTERKP